MISDDSFFEWEPGQFISVPLLRTYYRKFLNKMGSSKSQQMLGEVRSWRELMPKRAQIQGSPSLVQDKLSSQYADCYEIPMISHHNYQLKLMLDRKNVDDPSIIKLIEAKIKEKTILECGDMDVVQVFTEPISCRFEQIQLEDLENMLVLQQVLRASQILVRMAANYFIMTSQMIGFTENGRTKVWLNKNFGKHQIDQNSLLRNEQQMVRAIVQIFTHKFTRNYQFLRASNLLEVSYAIQSILKIQNKFVIQSQIQNKLKSRVNQLSSKKLSISQKSINEIKNKRHIYHRPSIDKSIDKRINFSQIRSPQSKQNQHSKCSIQQQSALKIRKSIINNAPNAKISLADISINYLPVSHQQQSHQIYAKPLIRINYQNSIKASQNYAKNELNDDSKLTFFPKEQSFSPNLTVKPQKKILLRPSYRRCSDIIERSEQGQDTESEVSQIIESQDNPHATQFTLKQEDYSSEFSNPFYRERNVEALWMSE